MNQSIINFCGKYQNIREFHEDDNYKWYPRTDLSSGYILNNELYPSHQIDSSLTIVLYKCVYIYTFYENLNKNKTCLNVEDCHQLL